MSVGPLYVFAPPMTAQNDTYSTTQGAPLTVATPGVLSNDSGGGGLGMIAKLVSSSSHGSVSLQANGAFTSNLQFTSGAFGGRIDGRVNTATGERYAVWLYPETTAGGPATIKVIKFSGWTAWGGTAMMRATLPSVGTLWHSILVGFRGSSIQVSVDGVQYLNVTDNGFDSTPAYTTGGIGLDEWTSSTPDFLTVQNVIVGSQ